MVIAIVGATGLVGSEIIKVLEEKKIKEIKEVLFVATQKSVGKKITYNNQSYKIITIKEALEKKPNFALFSAGSKVSKKYAKEFSKQGTRVIDNSSAFRMDKKIKLIVPEINSKKLKKTDKIIANPNCSTTQLVLALSPIHKKYKIKRIIVSTYQAVVGTGYPALKQLEEEEQGRKKTKVYTKNIHRNIIPHCDEFEKNGYTKEEEKIINETNKILESNIKITATAVRVPTVGGHGESVNIELKKPCSIKKIVNILKKQKGIIVEEDNNYKTPEETKSKNEVFVSRIRKDNSQKNSFNMWIVADPLRKGAATNAVQILESLINLNN
tara:strand:- start:43 stop:1020 length:978 start_codon:yes stop_codon:yes gene_type:complete